MSSKKIIEIAKKIVRRDRQVFDNLMEFERTKKIRTKARLNFTIDKSIADKFRRYSREKGYNMSAKVEQAIEEMMNKRVN
jgi:hypothetical protein